MVPERKGRACDESGAAGACGAVGRCSAARVRLAVPGAPMQYPRETEESWRCLANPAVSVIEVILSTTGIEKELVLGSGNDDGLRAGAQAGCCGGEGVLIVT